MGSSNRNRRIDILRAITIILIVMYHEGRFPPGLFWTSKFFPFNTYIICLFFFISGYLFKPFELKRTAKFLLNKTKHLAIPFLCWNLVYGIIVYFIDTHASSPFSYLPPAEDVFTIRRLLITPFFHGHQYVLNLATWFVGTLYPAIIIYGILNAFGRKYIPEWAWLLFYSATAILALTFLQSNSDFLPVNRISYALFFIQFGRCYKIYFEKILERIPSYAYLSVLFIVQYLICRKVDVQSYVIAFNIFNDDVITPLACGILGILICMRLSRIIETYIVENKLERLISGNTWSIMTHHILVKFVFTYIIIRIGLEPDPNAGQMFHDSIWYIPSIINYYILVTISVAVPIIWQLFFNQIKSGSQKLAVRCYNAMRRKQ